MAMIVRYRLNLDTMILKAYRMYMPVNKLYRSLFELKQVNADKVENFISRKHFSLDNKKEACNHNSVFFILWS